MTTPREPTASQRTENPPDAELLHLLLQRLRISHWDVLLVGDGSGCQWEQPAGWASALVDRNTRGRRLSYGAANAGSINFAESLPYMQALSWYDKFFGKARLRELHSGIHVHVLTDSQIVARWGTEAANLETVTPLPRDHIAIWSTIREYRRLGYVFTFHWAPRLTSGLNWAADLIAGLCRRQITQAVRGIDPSQGVNLVERAAAALTQVRFDYDIYALNPETP